MIAMIFEFELNEDHLEEYGDHAQLLKNLITSIDGFISIERFRSESNPEKTLALGFFKNEDAVKSWRNVLEHRKAQALGRKLFFTDYRLRMAEVTRDYGMSHRAEAPKDSRNILN